MPTYNKAVLRAREIEFLSKFMAKTAEELGAADIEVVDRFPSGPKGRVSHVNGLYRTNWFNSRLLTAEAFRADQIYTDTRARMVAQIHPPGIAWGLTLEALGEVRVPVEGIRERPVVLADFGDAELQRGCTILERLGPDRGRKPLAELFGVEAGSDAFQQRLEALIAWCSGTQESPGLPLGTRMQLAPGLAFDDLGRPISVGDPFAFTFTDLVQKYRTRPTVVTGGGTSFAPCACVQVLPPEAVPPGASLPEGPYLLLISPIEAAEGEARRVANPCAGRTDDGTCRADGWRGGFELSLSRLQVQIPAEQYANGDRWALRGLLAGYYFDVYEHDLRSRWHQPAATRPWFPADLRNWAGPGPGNRVDAKVPLALVYIGADGSVWFVDEWIPRRPLVATGSHAWADNARGTSTPASRVARLHQFQTMLEQSLEATPQFAVDDNEVRYGPNLYDRGFRHIPPAGFLPVRPPPPPLSRDDDGTSLAHARGVQQAREDGRSYFRGTNVYVIAHVAIHDDDVLEDMLRAEQKDPVTLQPHERTQRQADALLKLASRQNKPNPFVILLAVILRQLGDITLDQFVHRDLEVVKLIVPMDPSRRKLAVVGQVGPDPMAGLFDAVRATDGVQGFDDLASEPHRFVVYVKQRLVWLDALYLLVDMAFDLLEVLARTTLDSTTASPEAVNPTLELLQPRAMRVYPGARVTPGALRKNTAPLRYATGETARVLLEQPTVRGAVITGLGETFPELRLAGEWRAYRTAVARDGLAEGLQAMADEYQGFGVLAGLSLVLPEDAFGKLTVELEERARPVGGDADRTLAGTTFHRSGTLAPGEVRDIAGVLKDAYREKPVAAITPIAEKIKVGEVLDEPNARVERRVGPVAAQRLKARVAKDAEALNNLAPRLAKAKVLDGPRFFDELREAREKTDGDLVAGLRQLAEGGRNKAAARDLLEATEVLGADGGEVLVAKLERLTR